MISETSKKGRETKEKNVPYTVEFDAKTDCIRVILRGTFDLEASRDCAGAAAEASRDNNCYRILYDGRQAVLAMPVGDLYRLPTLLEDLGIGRSHRRALLVSKQIEDFRFYETASRNRGYSVRVFDDEARAVTWLMEPREPVAPEPTQSGV